MSPHLLLGLTLFLTQSCELAYIHIDCSTTLSPFGESQLPSSRLVAIIEKRVAMGSATSGYNPIEMYHSALHFTLLTVFSSLAVIVVILRLWAQWIQKKAFLLADYLTVLGLVSFRENNHGLSLVH